MLPVQQLWATRQAVEQEIKDGEFYAEIAGRHGLQPAQVMAIGNSKLSQEQRGAGPNGSQ